ncbi:hypothetical protein BU16DRAFT_65607 [Lophium mytilinum]|uniref:Uncharacterized protein n=1 Tax=Lophium mytilinum TaxID=390894 RepID=A0A6A6QQX7_9PEZI|nr:hypothetical protein BU16DRAFT_65607 [Lophium mytilinum]
MKIRPIPDPSLPANIEARSQLVSAAWSLASLFYHKESSEDDVHLGAWTSGSITWTNERGNYTPSLLYSKVIPTESSISGSLASRMSGFKLLEGVDGLPEEVDGVLEEVDGVLELRPNLRSAAYECAFWFLSCSYVSTDEEEWRAHCASHFQGEQPPKSVQCPLCDEFNATFNDGREAWDARMKHVVWHHDLGQSLQASRPDFHLFQHLWQKGLIDDAALEELEEKPQHLTRPLA